MTKQRYYRSKIKINTTIGQRLESAVKGKPPLEV